MTTQFTPGPWATSRDAVPTEHVQVTVYAEATGERVATVFERDANARVIAAAPNLYAALKAVDEGLRDGSIRFTKKRQADTDPYHPANVAMCFALALVEAE